VLETREVGGEKVNLGKIFNQIVSQRELDQGGFARRRFCNEGNICDSVRRKIQIE